MTLAPDAVLKDLKAKKFAPVYFLQGDEPYYIDKISQWVEDHALAPAERGFNQTVIYGKETSLSGVLNAARQFPAMSQWRVVIVKEAQEMADWNQERAKELLIKYLEHPVPSTLLLFAYKYKKLDARTTLAKTLAKNAVVVETKKLYDNQLPGWIKELFTELGHPINDKAVAMLAEAIGNDLSRLANEAEKLLVNFPEPGKPITEDAVATYVGISKEYNTFELQSALAKKDVLKANRIATYFAANPKNNPVIPVIALLFGYFSKLLLIHASADRSKAAVAQLLGINPFFADEYLLAARNYPLGQVVRVIGHLRQADLQAKGIDGDLGDGEILRELVFKVLH
ncbi:MAG: DNA polymerase III subunit delta [Bernardetiaceae bacterium]|jgi:DNA polymerase-3 subunit delta|nr:DNA polymerase III subunit delta [Bernardetiaceae bacterium]